MTTTRLLPPLVILGYERANSSRMGNPAYYVTVSLNLTDGGVKYRTKTNASVAYIVDEFRRGDRVTVALVGNQIVGITKIEN